MNNHQTRQAAQVEIRRLYLHTVPKERKTIEKYLRPLEAPQKPYRRPGGVVMISEVIPQALAGLGRQNG